MKTWHLSRDSLLWVDPSWTITIEELRSQEQVSLKAASWSRVLGEENIVVTDAFLTADGDILVAIKLSDDDHEGSEE